jgi:hypothetical protein
MTCLRELMEGDVLAAQSMFYFKPPGARGQAMHQDNFYLLVEPQTCVAAWTAIDDADPENGGMYLVADTAEEELVCPEKSNPAESFTTHFVPTPKGKKALPCVMKAGDTLFFNGSSIHGSGPNRSTDRFRRSFICHYVPKSTQRISRFYLPLLTPEGEDVMIEANKGGGPCGHTWQDGSLSGKAGRTDPKQTTGCPPDERQPRQVFVRRRLACHGMTHPRTMQNPKPENGFLDRLTGCKESERSGERLPKAARRVSASESIYRKSSGCCLMSHKLFQLRRMINSSSSVVSVFSVVNSPKSMPRMAKPNLCPLLTGVSACRFSAVYHS